MFMYLAHAGEAHGSTVDSVSHYFDSPLNAFMLWVALAASIHALALFTRYLPLHRELLTMALMHFGLGVFLYSKAPAIGAIVISVGFAITMWIVIAGLSVSDNTKGKK